MNDRIFAIVISAILLLSGCQPSLEPADPTTVEENQTKELTAPKIYAVADYDASRDPSQDLAETVELAARCNKRIILEIGGSW